MQTLRWRHTFTPRSSAPADCFHSFHKRVKREYAFAVRKCISKTPRNYDLNYQPAWNQRVECQKRFLRLGPPSPPSKYRNSKAPPVCSKRPPETGGPEIRSDCRVRDTELPALRQKETVSVNRRSCERYSTNSATSGSVGAKC